MIQIFTAVIVLVLILQNKNISKNLFFLFTFKWIPYWKVFFILLNESSLWFYAIHCKNAWLILIDEKELVITKSDIKNRLEIDRENPQNLILKPTIFMIPIKQYEEDIDTSQSKEEKNEILALFTRFNELKKNSSKLSKSYIKHAKMVILS